MTTNKENVFATRTILSVTTGRLLTKSDGSDNGVRDMYKILDYMTGGSNFTHQLGLAAEACKPVLMSEFPELSNVIDADIQNAVDDNRLEDWILSAPKTYGLKNEYAVPKVSGHIVKDPLVELSEMGVSNEDIIAVTI